MSSIFNKDILDQLVSEHDEHMREVYSMLRTGTPPEELAVHYAYCAGLQHAIRMIETSR